MAAFKVSQCLCQAGFGQVAQLEIQIISYCARGCKTSVISGIPFLIFTLELDRVIVASAIALWRKSIGFAIGGRADQINAHVNTLQTVNNRLAGRRRSIVHQQGHALEVKAGQGAGVIVVIGGVQCIGDKFVGVVLIV